MIFKKHLFLIVTAFLTTLLCSCYSNKSLNYNYGEAEGYRFYQGFYSSFSDGTNQKQLFEFIKIDNVDYTIMVDNITTFYYEDHVACIYEYSDNQYAFINYDIKNEKANLIETYTSSDVRFIVPNYYPVFYTKDSNGDVDSYTYHLYYQSQIISSDYELQSINSYGYFSLSKDNTLFISFSSNNTSEFKNGYRAVYNVSNLKTVYLYDERDIQSEIISFDCLSLEKQEIETNSFGQIEKAVSHDNIYFRNMYCSIWIEDIDNFLYLNGLGIDKALIMKTPDNYIPGYHLEFYQEFNCITADFSSSFEFTYNLDYKSFSHKTFKSYKKESFKYQLFEDDRYAFSSENIYKRLHPTGAVELDSYLLRYDKLKSEYEIMQKKHVHGFSNVFTFGFVLSLDH